MTSPVASIPLSVDSEVPFEIRYLRMIDRGKYLAADASSGELWLLTSDSTSPARRVATIERGGVSGIAGIAVDASQLAVLLVDGSVRVFSRVDWLERGLIQRVDALNRFIHDVYHEREILRAGLIPTEQVLANAQFRPEMQGVQVAATLGHGVVVLTTGGRTEQFAMKERPELPAAAFVQMGDFLRYALDTAVAEGLREVVIGGMVGKLTKIAQGETITHANRAEVDTGLLAELAASIGAPADECAAIAANVTARFASERMEALGLLAEFHTALARNVVSTLTAPDRYADRFRLQVLVCDFDGHKIAEASSMEERDD